MPQVGMLRAGGLGMPLEVDTHLAAVGDTGRLGDTGREVGAGSQAGVVGRLAAGGQGTLAVGQGSFLAGSCLAGSCLEVGTGRTEGPREADQAAWAVAEQAQAGAELLLGH